MTARMVEILRKPLSVLIKYYPGSRGLFLLFSLRRGEEKFGKKLILNEREAIIRCHHTECSVEARGRKKTTSMANQGQGGMYLYIIIYFLL